MGGLRAQKHTCVWAQIVPRLMKMQHATNRQSSAANSRSKLLIIDPLSARVWCSHPLRLVRVLDANVGTDIAANLPPNPEIPPVCQKQKTANDQSFFMGSNAKEALWTLDCKEESASW